MSESQIFDDWNTYEKVVAGDYMHHSDFFAALVDEIDTRHMRALAVIDIGCGDAQPVLALLRRFGTERYVGIDQSATALERAREALTAEKVSCEMRHGSMLEELNEIDGQFDLAIASFSLHHLESDDKQAVLRQCRRLLGPDAMLAVIDVFMNEGESRPAYFERWRNHAKQTFMMLSAGELEALLEHVHRCDIPETVSSYDRFGRSAGFTSVDSIREDHERLNKLVVLY
jgi:ubiquinone/menaquinone biosynthesis C-methylase UbiE